jgi:cytochrome c5
MRSVIGLSVCLLTLLGCASPKAVEPNPDPAVAAVKETDDQKAQRLINYSVESGEAINTADGKKIICKQESVTNTRLKNKKLCLTQAEWQTRTANAKDGFKEALDSSQALPPRGN